MTSNSREQMGYGAIDNKANPPTIVDVPFGNNDEEKVRNKLYEECHSTNLGHRYQRSFWEYLSNHFCIFFLLSMDLLILSVFVGSTVVSTQPQRLEESDSPLDQTDGCHESIAYYPLISEEDVDMGAGGYDDLSKYTGNTLMSARRFSSTIDAAAAAANNNSTKSTTSLSKRLFQANLDLAHSALQSHYLQNMTHGTLDPNSHAHYSLQDIAYCATGLDDWKHLLHRATTTTTTTYPPEIQRFAAARIRSWEWYTSTTYGNSPILDPAHSIVLSDAARRYMEFERTVCRQYDLVYAAVVMAPCDRLWYWLANEMRGDALAAVSASGGGGGEKNVYLGWIEDNASYEHGALELEAFIDANEGRIDEDLAMRVYRTAMMGEVNFFRSAGRQSALPTNLL